MIEKIKIYGERNTGTTMMRTLLKRNFQIDMMRGNMIDVDEPDDRPDEENGPLKDEDWLIRTIARERWEAIANERVLPVTLGWKHMRPPIALLQSKPEVIRNALFVVTVKHPVFWMKSFYKHPYHSYFRTKDMTFSDFVRKIFIPTTRDNVNTALYDSAVDLYAAKIDGYRELAALGLPFHLVRYEEMVQDIPAFLIEIGEKFEMSRKRKKDKVLEESTKGDGASLEDFQNKYQLSKVKDAVSPEDYEFIMEHFGQERLAWLGYSAG